MLKNNVFYVTYFYYQGKPNIPSLLSMFVSIVETRIM